MSTWTLCGSTPARCPTSGPISSSCGTTRELLSGQDLRVGLSWQCQNPTWAVLWSPPPQKKTWPPSLLKGWWLGSEGGQESQWEEIMAMCLGLGLGGDWE